MSDKPIPPGLWVFVRGYPHGITAEQVAEHIRKTGFEITADHVTLRDYHYGVSALVSLPSDEMFRMAAWVISQVPYEEGLQLRIDSFSKICGRTSEKVNGKLAISRHE